MTTTTKVGVLALACTLATACATGTSAPTGAQPVGAAPTEHGAPRILLGVEAGRTVGDLIAALPARISLEDASRLLVRDPGPPGAATGATYGLMNEDDRDRDGRSRARSTDRHFRHHRDAYRYLRRGAYLFPYYLGGSYYAPYRHVYDPYYSSLYGAATFSPYLYGAGTGFYPYTFSTTPPFGFPMPARGGQGNVVVTIVNASFMPANVTVSAGGTVTWSNMDATPHTATSRAGAFDTGTIAAGATSQPVTFGTPGAFPYTCTLHPRMAGNVIVR